MNPQQSPYFRPAKVGPVTKLTMLLVVSFAALLLLATVAPTEAAPSKQGKVPATSTRTTPPGSGQPQTTVTPVPGKPVATTTSEAVNSGAQSASVTYDILSYMLPSSGAAVGRSCSGAGCSPPTIWNYQMPNSNTFYYVLGYPGRSGNISNSYTSFQKYGYDQNYIWLMRDTGWSSGASDANASDVTSAFPTQTVIPTSNSGQYVTVPAGYVGATYFGKRFMSVGDFVTIPTYNAEQPINTIAWKINSDGTWAAKPISNFSATQRFQLIDAGTKNFGGSVGSKQYITIDRNWDFRWTSGTCLHELYTYALGVGWVTYQEQYCNGTSSIPVNWINYTGTAYSPRDVATGSGTSPVDPATDHVYVNLATQLNSRKMQAFFQTSAEPYYSEDKSIVLYAPTGDGSYYTYDFNFSGNSKFKGQLTGLRFDPSDGVDPVSDPDCRCWGFVRMRTGDEVKNVSSSYSFFADINGVGDTQGFLTTNMMAGYWPDSTHWIMQPSAADPFIHREGLSVNSRR